MIPLALAVAAGEMAGRFFPALSGWAPAGVLVSLAALLWIRLRRGVNACILILCACCCFLAAWRQGVWEKRLVVTVDSLPLTESLWLNAVLVADAPNRAHPSATGRWSAPARVTAIGEERIARTIPVRLYGSAKVSFRRGDFVKARIRLSPPRPPAFPGAFNSAFRLERDGLAASANAARGRNSGEYGFEILPVDSPPLPARARRVIDAVRAEAVERTLAYGGEYGPMLAAMLYGYRDALDSGLNDVFRRVGIGHVLAISGLHVGLVIGVLWWLSGWLPLSGRGRAVACLVAAVVYLGLSGGQTAAARATLMAVIHLGARAAGRRADMLNSLGAAAFFIILHNPTAPLDVSFQLSFTAVVFIYIALRARVPHGGRLRAEAVSLTLLSIATWAGLYPIAAYVFHQVNLVGLPINVVVIPLMGAVLAGGLLLPVLGWIPGAAFVLTLPSRALTWTAFGADALPYSSLSVHSPSGWWMAVFYVFVFLYLLNRLIVTPAARRRWLVFCAAGVIVGLLGVTVSMRSLPPPAESRLKLLPGSGLGVISAETPDGAIALVGQIRRQGLTEAEWLHSLRRRGRVSVVTLGGGKHDTLSALDFHYPVAARERVPLTAKREAGAPPEWRPVPEAPGIEYAVVRNERGRATALLVRAGGKVLTTAMPGPRGPAAGSGNIDPHPSEQAQD